MSDTGADCATQVLTILNIKQIKRAIDMFIVRHMQNGTLDYDSVMSNKLIYKNLILSIYMRFNKQNLVD